MLLKLCDAFGVSGADEEVKDIIISEIKDYCDVKVMKDGNIIAYKKGKKTPSKKFMIYAHTDEVGLIVKDITREGYLKFDEVGGIDDRILLGKKVYIGDNRIPGIVGCKPIHMTSKKEREITVKKSEMLIDIGASSKEDALNYVQYGDYILFDSKSFSQNDRRIIGKALDNRVGVATLIKLIKSDNYYDFYASFNSLEEIGLKGAATATEYVKPDVALILEGTTCSDVYKTKEYLMSTKLGEGVALSIHDRGSTSSKSFNEYIEKLANDNNIKFQFKRTNMGGNDAGAIQCGGKGVKTAVLSLPVRYIHSPVSIADYDDYNNCFKLSKLIVDNIGGFYND